MALSDTISRTTLRIHQQVYERTGGLLGHRLLGVPTLLLHTTGRRSGKPRTNALVYAADGARQLVVASKGGADEPPAWLLNLKAKPDVEVQIGRNRRPATATVIVPGDDDYDRVWKIVNDGNGQRFAEYQTRTSRPIPVVALTPS